MLAFTKQQVKEIAEQLDIGFRAFYHKQTGELVFVPDETRLDALDTDAWQDDLDKLEENFLYYQEIGAMRSKKSFKVMVDFAEQLTDRKLKNRLLTALEKKKPFREFKFVIDNVGKERQQWFSFKDKRYIEWTEEQLNQQNEIDKTENYG